MKVKLILLLTLFFNVAVHATRVEGVIIDKANAEPIIGAAVYVKDTKIGTVTNFDGEFNLEVEDSQSAVLVISYVGYKTQSISLKGKTTLKIVLEEDTKQLEDVIVVGYGQMKKSDLTGSVTSVQTKEDEAARSTSVDRMLQGKAAGLNVSTGNAAPGGAVNIVIRGQGSLRSNNGPLYVVDGNIIYTDDTADPMGVGSGSGNSIMTTQNPLSQISPQDIESIEVLKDASATAIYGAQGANGVILITTKSGKTAKPKVTLSSTVTASAISKYIPMLSPSEYLLFANSSEFGAASFKTFTGNTPVDWQREMTRLAISQTHRATVSGKAEKTNYYVAGGYMNNQGVIKSTGVNQFDFRINLDQEISKYVKLKTNTFYSNLNTTMTSGSDKLSSINSSIIRQMLSYKPYNPSNLELDQMDEEVDLNNPYSWLVDYDDVSTDEQFNTNLQLSVDATKWLTFQLKGGYVSRKKERSIWQGPLLNAGAKVNGKAGISTLNSQTMTGEALMLFNKKIKKHTLSGTVGTVAVAKDLRSTQYSAEGFFDKTLRADGVNFASLAYPLALSVVPENTLSFLGRGVYNYDNRYVLTATYRADGSNKFEGANKWGYFPSFAFAWRVNQEKFMKKVDAISNFKFRAGWGQVGNSSIPNFQTEAVYNATKYSSTDGSTYTVGPVSANIPNSDLKWETAEQTNFGLDYGMFDQRVNLTVDVYEKNTRDLLQYTQLPSSTGYGGLWQNRGKMRNRGLEISLDVNPIKTKNFNLSLNGNISFVENRIMELGLTPTDFGVLTDKVGYLGDNLGNGNNSKFPVNIYMENYPVAQFFGYQTNGIMQQADYDAQVVKLTYAGQEIKPGDIKLVDQNKDNVIDASDRTILGDPTPDFVYAFGTSISYKNFSLDMMFNGVQGIDVFNANLLDEWDVSSPTYSVRKEAFYQAWTPANQSNTFPHLDYETAPVLLDRYIEDGSYLRLSNVALGYTLNLPEASALKTVQFNASVSNVFILTKYSGYDPDVSSYANDISRVGVDWVSYPSTRNFTLGVIATF